MVTTAYPLQHARYDAGPILGQGSQGVVLRVVDREAPSASLVAKVWVGGGFDASTLTSEFALLRRCRIRGLVRARDFGFDEATGAPFFVEDFVEGVALAEALRQGDAATRDRTFVAALADTLETLSALHRAGFVHGDLKPAHVKIDRRGRAILLDLGAAVVRGAGPRAFTEGFRAPELRGGAPTSAETDLWALGATFVHAATGELPRTDGPPLRQRAPFLRASVAELVERLLAQHPRDRPASATLALEALGRTGAGDALRGARPSPVGRAAELAALFDDRSPVIWLAGPPGVGKTFLAEELTIEALRSGASVRAFRFPEAADPRLTAILSYLRGTDGAWPFAGAPPERTWLVFDGLERAPAEVLRAIEAYRCRAGGLARVLAVAREAPEGSSPLVLAPLVRADFEILCRDLGIDEIDAAWTASAGIPAWPAATAGRVPLTADAAIARTRPLGAGVTKVLASIALLGGILREPIRSQFGMTSAAVATLIESGLLSRAGGGHALAQPSLAADLAAALGSCAIVDELATGLLASGVATSTELALLAAAPYPATKASALLEATARAARSEGLPIVEATALLELLADPAARTPERLLRLERLTRDTADAAAQERVFQWLAACVAPGESSELACVFRRRSAERAARRGAHDEALAHAEAAIAIAPSPTARALAIATRGTVALFAAQWERARRDYDDARAMLASATVVDAEELARLDHNLGVVALYKEDLAAAEESFVRALERKRALGDLAGVRSVLLNLGITRARTGAHEAAARDLDEAIRLARALRQRGGLGWCLVARADLALRVGALDAADAQASEARALEDALSPAVRADLALVDAALAVRRGLGRDAIASVARIDEALRRDDPLVDAKAEALLAEAYLAKLPAEPRAAARAAIRALRRARAAKLAELQASALATLRRARDRRTVLPMASATVTFEEGELVALIHACAATSGDAAIEAFLREVVRTTRAERAFAALEGGRVVGVDLDGLAIADAARRLPIAEGVIEPGVRYAREADKNGGRGSHVVVRPAVEGSIALVLEHRFAPAHFDALAEPRLLAWASLLAIVARGRSSGGTAVEASLAITPPPPAFAPETPSTVMPNFEPRRAFPGILGDSVALKRSLARLDAAIDGDLPTLVLGETGVGKELFARALHELGARARGPFVAVNCAAIPEALFEAELFGHSRGAFTGADRERRGLLARAEGGTLFLDEIGELALARQATLLRALETKRYRPVGSDDERPFDVRIVSATNRDLAAEVERGGFRRDLLYRLCVLEVRVPPLREREGDVPLLVRHYLPGVQIAADAMDALCSYRWPGNVRELAHQAQRLAALRAPSIELAHLPREIRSALANKASRPARGERSRPVRLAPPAPSDPREEVRVALEATGGNISRAAVRLGLTRHGLKKRMLRLGLRSKES